MKIAIASGKGGTGKTFLSTNLFWIAAQRKIDVEIIDCDSEEPNVSEFLNGKLISQETVSQNIPIIFMTGFADREIVMECMSYKPTGYMVKPIVKGELLSRLDQIFE